MTRSSQRHNREVHGIDSAGEIAAQHGETSNVPPPLTLGAEILDSPTFGTPADWTAGTGWTIAGSKATTDGSVGALLQGSVVTTVGSIYQIEVAVSGTFGSKAHVSFGSVVVGAVSSSGTYLFYAQAVAGSVSVSIEPADDGGMVGDVTTFSLKPVVIAS